jgi:co-chaperonin GroES (HSP10)
MIRATQDNVVVRLLPLPRLSAGGIHIPQTAGRRRTGVREAEVLAVGPGHHRDSGFGGLVPTTVMVGEVVLVDEFAGQDYSFDNYRPRQNKGADLGGELRIVREDEIHAVLERDQVAGPDGAA